MNCKPGDLAIVVAAQFPENNGKIVEVLSAAFDGELYPCKRLRLSTTKRCWWVRSSRPFSAVSVNGKRFVADVVPFADSALRPLPPPETVDDVTTNAPIEVRDMEPTCP